LGLAIVLSMLLLGIAWGLYIFSGAVSKTTLLVMSIAGAGLGAGLGASLAWLRIDRNPPLVLTLMFALGILGGVLGGWAGYQYGSNKEVECCAMPETAPFTYTAFGATLGANALVFALIIAREIVLRVWRPVLGRARNLLNI
jgi:hypothetical protein